jgi:hypothetical protein
MKYFGDIAEDATIRITFNTNAADGSSVTYTGGTVAVYKDSNTTESQIGISVSKDHDGKTGAHLVVIDTSPVFFVIGSDYNIMLQDATIDGQTVTVFIGSFSIENRSQIVSELSAAALDSIWDEVIEGTITARQAKRLMLSILTGKSSGGGGSTLVFRDIGDTKDRVSVTADNNGNRTAVGTRDGT